MDEEQLIKFYRDLHELKHKQRKGWKKIGKKGFADTIASHSFGAAVLGWFMAEDLDLDSEKVIKMLLSHDFVMAHMRDLTPEEQDYSSKKQLENVRKDRVIENLPEEVSEEFEELFSEYQAQETRESRVARECDKLDTVLQSLFYSKELKQDKSKQFIESYEKYFKSDVSKKVLSRIEDELD